MTHAFLRFLGGIARLDTYGPADLRGDAQAGLTTAVMVVPQGMAYAMLAGLPPVMGLYAALVPLVVYSLVGTSRQLAVGPVAIDSLITASGVGALAAAGTDSYLAHATLLAAMVGLTQVVLGFLRLGVLVRFISHPVISGFTSAAAVVIATSQLHYLTGIDLPRTQTVHRVLVGLIEHGAEINGPTVALGLASMALIITIKKVRRDLPAALVAVVVGTLVAWALGLDAVGVSVVGSVPAGLPTPGLPLLDPAAALDLLPTALTLALIGFIEAIAVGRALARRAGHEINENRELVGIGLANLAGGLTRAFPVTGGFARSAVNADAGARSRIAGLITAAAVGLTLLVLTPLFHYLPRAVLAAIIVTAVIGLVDIPEVRRLWKVKRVDLIYLGLTFVATLVLGIKEGIAVGVGVSIVALIIQTTRPRVVMLGRLPGTEVYRTIERYPEAEVDPGVLVVRFDGRLYFGNAARLKRGLAALENGLSEPPSAVVLVASGVNTLDSSAEAMLRDMLSGYEDRGIRLYVAEAKGPVRDVLSRSGFLDRLGEDALCLTTHEAVVRARRPTA